MDEHVFVVYGFRELNCAPYNKRVHPPRCQARSSHQQTSHQQLPFLSGDCFLLAASAGRITKNIMRTIGRESIDYSTGRPALTMHQ